MLTLAQRPTVDTAPLDLRAVHPFYRLVFDDGETISCHADPAAMEAETARILDALVPNAVPVA